MTQQTIGTRISTPALIDNSPEREVDDIQPPDTPVDAPGKEGETEPARPADEDADDADHPRPSAARPALSALGSASRPRDSASPQRAYLEQRVARERIDHELASETFTDLRRRERPAVRHGRPPS